jgi:hypothetical protein
MMSYKISVLIGFICLFTNTIASKSIKNELNSDSQFLKDKSYYNSERVISSQGIHSYQRDIGKKKL